jgi:prepilin peptidase CpaA
MADILALPHTRLLALAITGLLIGAALHDLAFRTIPNGIPFAICAIALVLRYNQGSLPEGALVACIVFVASFLIWRRGLLGGGDVKLISAASLSIAPAMALDLLFCIALAGGALALIYIVLRRLAPPPAHVKPARLASRILRVEQWRIRRGGPLPYASAIAAGTIFVLFQG